LRRTTGSTHLSWTLPCPDDLLTLSGGTAESILSHCPLMMPLSAD
jgi:hypothetical protein